MAHSAAKPGIPPLKQDRAGELAGPDLNIIKYPQGKARVIGNSDSKRYHLPGMKYYHKVKAYHQVIFNSESEAIKAGYTKARE